MTITSYTPLEYQNYIRQSRRNHLLVEGGDDKRLFERFMEEFFGSNWKEALKLDIDIAEDLHEMRSPETLGNREKVEEICSALVLDPCANRLTGFVDREFRDFIWDSKIVDQLEAHKIIDRLVWSRGHSIENYFFDFSTLRDPLRELSITDKYEAALILFEACFVSALRLAATLSLVGYELGACDRIIASIREWKIFEIATPKVKINNGKWINSLTSQHGYTVETTQTIMKLVNKWASIIENTEPDVARWVCHGHLGLSIFWAIFAQCVYQTCGAISLRQKEAEARNVLNARSKTRFNVCGYSWIRNINSRKLDYPREILTLFNY